jgi:hypothetical protein
MRTLKEVQEMITSYQQELHDELQNLTALRVAAANNPFDATSVYNEIEESKENVDYLHAKIDALTWVLK